MRRTSFFSPLAQQLIDRLFSANLLHFSNDQKNLPDLKNGTFDQMVAHLVCEIEIIGLEIAEKILILTLAT